ncbi:MAG TPA: phosphatidate cytidylyltransferase [Bacteroidales bacterium]|nr:phosphatidate cytidylyltransferase [Bacteroidales bacterium]
MNNFLIRTLTGFVFAALIVSAIIIDLHVFYGLFLVFTVLGLWEFYSLAELSKIYPAKILGVLSGVLVFLINTSISLGYLDNSYLLFNIIPFFLVFLAELYRRLPNPFTNISFTILGHLYIAVPFSLLGYLPNINPQSGAYQPEILLGFFIMNWLNDSVAFLVGSNFGKIKLIEEISPRKTWEGTLTGGLFTLLAAYILSIFFADLSLINWLAVAILTVFFGNYGDLFESLFKRSLKIKESGSIFPGHGGILDRFDGVLIAAPFVYVYLIFAL